MWAWPITLLSPLQVICLQAFVRRWLAQRKAVVLRMERDRRLAWQEQQVRRRREEQKEQLLERHRRWSDPQRREDFNQLYRSVASKACCFHLVDTHAFA